MKAPAQDHATMPRPLQQLRHDFLLFPHTIANARRDFREWHLGRPRYLLWAIVLEDEAVDRRVAAAGRHLDGLLLEGYERQPHITLCVCGFPTPRPRRPDDFGPEHLANQLRALARLRLPPFRVEIGPLESFASAPFLHVRDENASLSRLHACLTPGIPDNPGREYVPHVTVGLYAGPWPTAEAARRLDSCPDQGALLHPVRAISLMSYASAEIGGPLTRLADYRLKDGTLVWHGEFPFPASTVQPPSMTADPA